MSIDSYSTGVILVLLTVALSVAGLYLVRRTLTAEALTEHHEVAGYLLSVIGTMYAVLLGLVVVDAMSKFQDARSNVQSEANCLADVFFLSERYPPAQEKQIKTLCKQYVDQVVDKEWREMDDSFYDPEARHTAINLIRAVTDFEPKTQSQQAVYPLVVQEVCQLWDCRRRRVNSAQYGVPAEEWLVLIIGGIVTIVFTYFFSVKKLGLQIAMTALCSVLISLNLLLVLWFGYPFSGDRIVRPDAFVGDKKIFENELERISEIGKGKQKL